MCPHHGTLQGATKRRHQLIMMLALASFLNVFLYVETLRSHITKPALVLSLAHLLYQCLGVESLRYHVDKYSDYFANSPSEKLQRFNLEYSDAEHKSACESSLRPKDGPNRRTKLASESVTKHSVVNPNVFSKSLHSNSTHLDTRAHPKAPLITLPPRHARRSCCTEHAQPLWRIFAPTYSRPDTTGGPSRKTFLIMETHFHTSTFQAGFQATTFIASFAPLRARHFEYHQHILC